MSILKISLISTVALLAMPIIAQSADYVTNIEQAFETVAEGKNVVGAQKVSFNNNSIKMAGNLYLPANYESGKKYPAIVVAHPWGGVKEQTSGLYAQKLAQKGYVTLAYDASHYGESEGLPLDLENPADRVQDIRAAVGYLASLPQVDASRIGAVGICAGGGYILHEAQSDLRVKAVASIVAYDIGEATRTGIQGAPVTAQDRQKLELSVAEQLNKEAAGDPILVAQLLPSRDQINTNTDNFTREATEYYLTPRGSHPNARNRFVVTSPGLHIAYYPMEYMELISPRPVLLITGAHAETRKFSETAFAKAKEPKELLVIPGASHFDLYDKPQYVTPAIDKMSEFFRKNL